jgi:glycosyltransferase involved in cell wall biosynthesis
VRRALIVAYWLTDYGGLHENVFDTAQGLAAAGWRVTVMAPAAKVKPRFVDAGAEYLCDPLDDVAAGAGLAIAHGPFDLVHAHPFAARRVGAAVAAALGVPLVVTLHGQYDDEFDSYGSTVRHIVCVSAAVADYVASRAPRLADRLAVIPNGVDFDVFTPAIVSSVVPPTGARKIIAIASRLDPDKGVLSDVIADLVTRLGDSGGPVPIELRVAGERLYGPPVNPLTAAIDRAAASGRVAVARAGWITDRQALRQFYTGADIVVAPGRAAMEAIACGVPTIAAASRGYIGLVNSETLPLAHNTNFGGVQLPTTLYSPGAIVDDLSRALAIPLAGLRDLRQQLRNLHDVRAIQAAHVALYVDLCEP